LHQPRGWCGAYASDAPQAADLILAASDPKWPHCGGGEELLARGICVRLVSMPSWSFDAQLREYRDAVLPLVQGGGGAGRGLHRYVGDAGEVLANAGASALATR
jgi:transketolase